MVGNNGRKMPIIPRIKLSQPEVSSGQVLEHQLLGGYEDHHVVNSLVARPLRHAQDRFESNAMSFSNAGIVEV